MKLKIFGASHHIVTTPTYDPRGQPTGNKETGLLELIMIPAGDDPQHACMRFNVQIYAPDDATLLKFRPTTILDVGEISTAAAEAINAAYFAPPVPQRAISGLSVSSGYRCPELNAAVGGVPDSAHIEGLAADVHVVGIGQTDLTNFFADTLVGYDQIINEGTWTHIGLTNGVPRMERMVAHFDSTGKATYTEAA